MERIEKDILEGLRVQYDALGDELVALDSEIEIMRGRRASVEMERNQVNGRAMRIISELARVANG